MQMKTDPNCVWPESECVMWRYMDFTKFVYMLEYKSLFFTSIKNLDDKYEGRATKETLNKIVRIQDKTTRNLGKIILTAQYQFIKTLYVNCWAKSNNEISTMWKSYASTPYSLAIKSTFSRIQRSFTERKRGNLFGSLIKYKDYDKDYFEPDNVLNLSIHKRKEFESEREFRIMYHCPLSMLGYDPIPLGQNFKVNLDQLITEVVLGPNTKPWFGDLIRHLLKKHSLDKKVSNSRIDADPRHDI